MQGYLIPYVTCLMRILQAVGVTCGRQYYTVTEDRPVIKEQIQYIREHHPYEKEFVVETKPTGRERELPNR